MMASFQGLANAGAPPNVFANILNENKWPSLHLWKQDGRAGRGDLPGGNRPSTCLRCDG